MGKVTGKPLYFIVELKEERPELEQRNITAQVIEVGCIGCCYLEPLLDIAKRGCPRVCYGQVTSAFLGTCFLSTKIVTTQHKEIFKNMQKKLLAINRKVLFYSK